MDTMLFCFGLSSTFRGQNNLAFRVWLGCYILHANTAGNLMAQSSVQSLGSSGFKVQTTELESPVLSYNK